MLLLHRLQVVSVSACVHLYTLQGVIQLKKQQQGCVVRHTTLCAKQQNCLRGVCQCVCAADVATAHTANVCLSVHVCICTYCKERHNCECKNSKRVSVRVCVQQMLQLHTLQGVSVSACVMCASVHMIVTVTSSNTAAML